MRRQMERQGQARSRKIITPTRVSNLKQQHENRIIVQAKVKSGSKGFNVQGKLCKCQGSTIVKHKLSAFIRQYSDIQSFRSVLQNVTNQIGNRILGTYTHSQLIHTDVYMNLKKCRTFRRVQASDGGLQGKHFLCVFLTYDHFTVILQDELPIGFTLPRAPSEAPLVPFQTNAIMSVPVLFYTGYSVRSC